MPFPDNAVYQVLSKRAGQQKAQVEEEFIPDIAHAYEDGLARADAQAFFDAYHQQHTGGTSEYLLVRCDILAREVRPIA